MTVAWAPRAVVAGAAALAWAACVGAPDDPGRRVEIVRTEYGVPHVFAEDLEAGGFGMAWVQMEDYGPRVVRGLLAARGEMGLHYGIDSVGGDFTARLRHRIAVEEVERLDPDAASVYRGFALGVNRFVAVHATDFGPDRFPGGVPIFGAADVLARDVVGPGSAPGFAGRVARLGVEAVLAGGSGADAVAPSGVANPEPGAGAARTTTRDGTTSDPGSNAWALAPSRTTSGNAILLRNPHLSWTAGYYEAHLRIPGVVDFYGDFRVGGPFGIVGGFSQRLAFATTNNGPDLEEVYALEVDPRRPGHVLFDGESVEITADSVTVRLREADGSVRDTTELFRRSPLGPVVADTAGYVFTVKAARAGEARLGSQFLRMMRARDLEEWREAMRMQARVASNFTYADADGNILYVWNAAAPALPHAPTGDTLATLARGADDVWSELIPWDSLPMLINPEGGYVHQENDPFHFTNLNEVFVPEGMPPSFPEPDLRLRSQLSLELIGGTDTLSLEDVVERKFDYTMLLSERVKDDLVHAVASEAGGATGRVAEARQVIGDWDGTVAPGSRGGVLFAEWWDRYRALVREDVGPEAEYFARPWSFERPTSTPRGIAHPALAVRAFREAVDSVTSRFGSVDVAWGEAHRARLGDVDVPVGGCNGVYGCFRVLWFEDAEDGVRTVRGGDGWVLAVEMGPTPRAYSVLAYGQSDDLASAHCCDQLEMFAEGRMKTVRFSEADVERAAQRTYRPGGDG